MADDILLNAPSVVGGKTVATKDVGGVQHEKIINEFLDGSGNPVMVSATDPLPVTDEVAEQALTDIAAGTAASLGQKLMAASVPVVISSDQSAIPVTGSFTPSGTQNTNEIQLGGTAIDTNSGLKSAGTQRIVIATDQPQLTNAFKVDGSAVTQPVSAAALPLPAGAATEATQLLVKADVDKIPSQGQALMAASTPVVIASNQTAIPVTGTLFGGAVTIADGADVAEGAIADAIVAAGAAGTVSAKLRRTTQGIDDLKTNISLAASANVIGHVINDASSAVIGHVINDAGSAIIGKVGIDQTTPGTTNLVALTAETTKAIGVVRNSDGAGNLLTSNSSTFSAKFALDGNWLGTLGTAFSTPGKVDIKSTQKPSYGATSVVLVTALQSLASSATVGWKSVRTSNLATLANDYEVFISLTTAASAPANDKAVYLYVIPWYTTDAGSTWFASSGGTATLPTSADATYTIASPNNFRLLGVLNYTTTSMTLQDTFLLSNCFGNRLPDGFSFCVINFSGATLGTGCVLDITPINDILI